MTSEIKFTHIIFLFLLLSSLSFASTLYVNATIDSTCDPVAGETNYATIQGAHDAAIAGDTLIVCDNGTSGYTETVTISKSLNVYGNQSGVLVKVSSNYVFIITANSVNITNFTVSGIGSTASNIELDGNDSYVYNVSSSGNYYSFFISSLANNNILTNNTASGNSVGFDVRGSNNTLTNNIESGGSEGFLFETSYSSNNTLTNNIASGCGVAGFYILSDSNTNTLIGNSASSSNTGFLFQSSNSNTFLNNTADSNVQYGFYSLGSSNNLLSNNTITENPTGLVLDSSTSNNLTKNNINNNTFTGVNIVSSSSNILTDNFVQGNGNGGFRLSMSSSSNTLTNNTVSNNSQYGVYITDSSGSNNVSSNTIFNNSQAGIYMDSSSGSNNLFSNSIYNHTSGLASGIFLQSVNAVNNIYNNSVIQNNTYGIYINASNLANITNNTASFNTYGFYFWAVNGNNLTSNNASNNTVVQYSFVQASNATFTGINYAQLTPAGGLDLNISGGSNVTTLVGSSYNNFTTTYGTIFFDSAINVSIKAMNLSDSGATATGCDSTAFSACTLITNNNNLVNITNNSATATISLGMFYNSTIPTTQMNFSKYNTSSLGWVNLSSSSTDTQNASILLNNIVSFSTFGIVAFTPVTIATATTSSSNTIIPGGRNAISLSANAICPANQVEVSAGISDVLVRLLITSDKNGVYLGEIAKNYSGSAGKVLFDLTEAGSYKVDAAKTNYDPKTLEFDFTPCSVSGENNTVVIIPKEETNTTIEKTEENKTSEQHVLTEEQQKATALQELKNTDSAITTALNSGKDVSSAKAKLAEANVEFAKGNYETALKLAQEAKQLLLNAPPSKITTTPVKTETGKTRNTGPKTQDFLAGGLVLMVVIVIVICAVAYLLLKGKGSPKGYTR